MSNRPGSPEWHRKFKRDQESFDRAWPWWVAGSVISVVVMVILVVTGVIPLWLLFV